MGYLIHHQPVTLRVQRLYEKVNLVRIAGS